MKLLHQNKAIIILPRSSYIQEQYFRQFTYGQSCSLFTVLLQPLWHSCDFKMTVKLPFCNIPFSIRAPLAFVGCSVYHTSRRLYGMERGYVERTKVVQQCFKCIYSVDLQEIMKPAPGRVSRAAALFRVKVGGAFSNKN